MRRDAFPEQRTRETRQIFETLSRLGGSETRRIVSSEYVTQRYFYSRLLISVGETGRPSRRSASAGG
ncbi:hypothetical protein KM043_016884 [Ampulex compressa]|nr:hypothetical protein KM043_016884 [Ampulex compressa]